MGSSMVEAVLGEQARVDFVGVNQVVSDHIRDLTASLSDAGTTVSGILLLGLPGVYKVETSPFPSLLTPDRDQDMPTLTVEKGVQDKLGALVFKGKYRTADVTEFYQIVQQTAVHNGISAQNASESPTMVVILGATELETLMAGYHRPPKSFQVFASGKIDAEFAPSAGKLNIILVKPQALVAQRVASLAIGIDSPQAMVNQQTPAPPSANGRAGLG